MTSLARLHGHLAVFCWQTASHWKPIFDWLEPSRPVTWPLPLIILVVWLCWFFGLCCLAEYEQAGASSDAHDAIEEWEEFLKVAADLPSNISEDILTGSLAQRDKREVQKLKEEAEKRNGSKTWTIQTLLILSTLNQTSRLIEQAKAVRKMRASLNGRLVRRKELGIGKQAIAAHLARYGDEGVDVME